MSLFCIVSCPNKCPDYEPGIACPYNDVGGYTGTAGPPATPKPAPPRPPNTTPGASGGGFTIPGVIQPSSPPIPIPEEVPQDEYGEVIIQKLCKICNTFYTTTCWNKCDPNDTPNKWGRSEPKSLGDYVRNNNRWS